MIDIQQEELSILELLKYGKTGCIYKSTDLYLNTNVVKAAPFIGNGVTPFVSYSTETFYFNSNFEISGIVIDFEIDKPYNSLFSDYEFFKNLPIGDFFVLTGSFGFVFRSILSFQDLDAGLNYETFAIDQVRTTGVYLRDLNINVNYLTNRLNTIGITFTFD